MVKRSIGTLSFGVLKSKSYESVARGFIANLCDTRHTITVGLSPVPQPDEPILPFNTSLIVVFEPEDTSGLFKTKYHREAALSHKAQVKVTNEDRVVFDSTLAGDTSGPKYHNLALDAPGQWTVEVTPLASGECSMPTYTFTESFVVEEPPSETGDTGEAGGSGESQATSPAASEDKLLMLTGAILLGASLLYALLGPRRG